MATVPWPDIFFSATCAAAYFATLVIVSAHILRRGLVFTRFVTFSFLGFLLFNGATHLLELAMIWYPLADWLSVMRLSTAILTIAVALLAFPVTVAKLGVLSQAALKATVETLGEAARQRGESLAMANERLELSHEAAGLTSWEWDLPTDEMTWTSGLRNLVILGQQKKLRYRDVVAGVHPDDRQATLDAAYAAVASKSHFISEFRVMLPNNSVRWILSRGKVFLDDQGNAVRMLGVNMDITERKVLEANLREREQAAAESNLAKTQFLANMSHEIRTPLTAMVGFSELLKNENYGQNEVKRYAEIIFRNGAVLQKLVNEILDLSKVEAGHMEVDIQSTSIASVLGEVRSNLSLQAEAKSIGLSVIVEPGIPSVVWTDPGRLLQILLNIVGNAVKFCDKGEVTVRTRALTSIETPSQDRVELEFEIHDTGIGISAQEQKVLFQMFSQADASTTRRFGGTGLGLALAKQLAQLLGGDVILKSSIPGQGSTFVILLPVALSAAQLSDPTRVETSAHKPVL